MIMFDCIYRDEVKQKIKERMKYLDDARIMNKGDTEILNQIKGFEKALNQIYCDIDDIRTAVQPVKHGKWESSQRTIETGTVYCSNCAIEYYISDLRTVGDCNGIVHYCPNCGARMDGDTE